MDAGAKNLRRSTLQTRENSHPDQGANARGIVNTRFFRWLSLASSLLRCLSLEGIGDGSNYLLKLQ